MIELLAPAKVNLTLHVTGKREDGYHNLDSLVMFADVGDQITVCAAPKTTLEVIGPMASGVPCDGNNVILQAASLLPEVAANIVLQKHLPHAAGLGGGSSDAAATLRALARLGNCDLPSDTVGIGADVPICLHAATARMQGVGEQITPLTELPSLDAVLVNPNLPVLTAEVFKRLRDSHNAPMPDEMPEKMGANELIEWLKTMRNDLQAPAIEAEPVIEQVFQALEVTPGCRLVRMSGSGGTCFGLYDDAETAAAAAGRLRENFPSWWVTATTLNGA